MENNKFNTWGFEEQTKFEGLMPKVMEKLGADYLNGSSNVNVSVFDPHANGVSSMEIVSEQKIALSEGSEPVPPIPPEEESDEYDYVYDEASWNESEENGALKKYHEKYPEEDWWNNVEDRPVNYNDRLYKGLLEDINVEGKAKWETDTAQSILINGTTYYARIFYGFEPQNLELYNDVNLTESTGKIFAVTEVTYSEGCSRCWKGAINNPGAQYPWICPIFNRDVNAKVIFRYEGFEDVQPWGDKTFHNGDWGCESVAKLYGNDFDINKFKMFLKHE